eukprot:Gregarina_sp_Pseudo_9__1738@NODE_217_length_3571_cov_38_779162_g202_i0_p3_GENE_NODE_217_length_3571_cov_38_779162_g202_i0NODE_217_length_3571_cov_38_779162_g202_i0_p3_ORF_typecomplete_len284_score46_25TRAM_LAG1_CLN8/PF03798_16/6e02TRAM_LAG1_CLN8/PF03798_16/1_6e19TerC/PF03741_16/6e02TerC/PF03741_16/1_5e03TerC/PF03741_16/1_8DUF2645/PF10840_8/7_4e02DUF2645/PF10840_8/0_13DUF2645/PF10840_8/1_6e02DUF2645/PF10840_8/5_4e03_NODE_217_length_3571_cov_38_779162_g202_i01961047
MSFHKHAFVQETTWYSHARWRPYLVHLAVVFALLWARFYKRVGDKVILKLVPQECRDRIAEKKRTDRRFEKACRVNGTAFVNAMIAVPIAIVTMIRLDEDHYRYESKLFDWAALVLLGYFLWDFFICIRQVDYFGKTFILHAVVSLAANWALLYAEELRTSWLAAALIATEISTPFLHLRWFLLQGKCRGWYLQIVNVVFLIAFVGYRLIAVELLAIFPFTKELLNWPQKEGTSPPLRLIFEGVIAWVWMLLNYYWGALLCYTQYKQLNKYFAKPEPVRPHGE